ncbi:PDZ domain containing protein [Nitzschia inconspicua]|uniref:PDZ domain containing protein n=1 Tax=Nitzschia inconspicua TaxID=303405 RepID=A0A9K3KVJ4_9STRA|nr:PDZ domain containing protein [Nitzschia inconspicua]
MTASMPESDIELGNSNGGTMSDSLGVPDPSLSMSYIDSLPVVLADSEEEQSAIQSEEMAVADNVVPLSNDSDWMILGPGAYKTMEKYQRPSLMSVCYYKISREDKIGISFQTVDGILQIKTIDSSKAIAQAPVRPGDHLMAIGNHRNCSRWTSTQTASYLKGLVGHFTMLFNNPVGDPNLHEAVVYKADVNDTVGVGFRTDERLRLRIDKLLDWGLIGKDSLCVLKEGDYIHKINGENAQEIEPSAAKMIVRSTPGMVSISSKSTNATEISVRNVADLSHRGYLNFNITPTVNATATESSSILLDSSVTGIKDISNNILQPSPANFDTYLSQEGIQPRFIYVLCDKPTPDTLLGVTFCKSDDKLIINKVVSDGVLWSSPLRGGYDMLAIDGKACNTWSSWEAREYLTSRQNGIALVARNSAGSCNYVVAQVSKPTPRSKIGVTFKKAGNGALQIGEIFPDSLFAGSILTDGCEVLTINGIPSRALSSKEAVSIVEHATSTLTILAKCDPSKGIVLAALSAEEVRPIVMTDGGRNQAEGDSRGCRFCALVSIILCITVFVFVIAAVGPADGSY